MLQPLVESGVNPRFEMMYLHCAIPALVRGRAFSADLNYGALFIAGSKNSAQLLLQQLSQLRRIGLALRRFHRLTNQRVECFFFAGPEFLD